MTLDRLVWDNLLPDENGEAEVVSMTLVTKDKEGTIRYYGVNEYGCFYKSEEV